MTACLTGLAVLCPDYIPDHADMTLVGLMLVVHASTYIVARASSTCRHFACRQFSPTPIACRRPSQHLRPVLTRLLTFSHSNLPRKKRGSGFQCGVTSCPAKSRCLHVRWSQSGTRSESVPSRRLSCQNQRQRQSVTATLLATSQ